MRKKKKYKNGKYYENNSKHRAENKDAIRQQQKKYKKDKDKIHAQRRERRKQKKEKQLLINQ